MNVITSPDDDDYREFEACLNGVYDSIVKAGGQPPMKELLAIKREGGDLLLEFEKRNPARAGFAFIPNQEFKCVNLQ